MFRVLHFNPRPPCGGRPFVIRCLCARLIFQSTPPVRGATVPGIKAPLLFIYFNPRPPCGGRLQTRRSAAQYLKFQSTPPVRGATNTAKSADGRRDDFNPRPPCGGRRQPAPEAYSRGHFNPRPPCGGRLSRRFLRRRSCSDFNPRPPCGGRPNATAGYLTAPVISIHAPRAGGDRALFRHPQ